MLYDTKKISKVLNTKDIGIIEIDISSDERWDCYNELSSKHQSNISAFYWNNLTENERKERLKNHGMTGKKHSEKTRKKMSNSSVGRPKTSLHKGGRLCKNDVVVEFTCITHFCKEHKLSIGHICELLQGKRKTVKGWKNVL